MILNEDGTINARKSWHEKCVNQYMLIYHSRERRAILRRRDKGRCAKNVINLVKSGTLTI